MPWKSKFYITLHTRIAKGIQPHSTHLTSRLWIPYTYAARITIRRYIMLHWCRMYHSMCLGSLFQGQPTCPGAVFQRPPFASHVLTMVWCGPRNAKWEKTQKRDAKDAYGIRPPRLSSRILDHLGGSKLGQGDFWHFSFVAKVHWVAQLCCGVFGTLKSLWKFIHLHPELAPWTILHHDTDG